MFKNNILKLLFIFVVFCLGLYYVIKQPIIENYENNTSIRCPNLLIQRGSILYLSNSRVANVPGVNPIKFNNLDERFLFIGPGYNVRPTEIQSAIALNQFKRLNHFIKIRNINRNKIINNLKKNDKWKNQFSFVEVESNIKPSWFGLPILINKKYSYVKKEFLNYLSKKGIENRPIISGNFLNQPAATFYNFKSTKNDFKNADEIEERGFFIGLHTNNIKEVEIKYISSCLLDIDKFK